MNSSTPNPDLLYSRTDGEGSPVVLLHGLGGSLDEWSRASEALNQAGYQTHRVDLPGHGFSHKPVRTESYTSSEVYRRIEAWFEGLELKDGVFVVAHSYGAYLAINLALSHASAVRRLVLVSPYVHTGQLLPLMRLTSRQPGVASRILEASPTKAVERVMHFVRSATHGLPQEAVRQSAADLVRASPKIVHIAPSIEDLRPLIPAIEVETLLVWGEKDLTLNPASFPGLLEELPDASGRAFERCGHAPHLSSSEVFNAIMLDFLGRGGRP